MLNSIAIIPDGNRRYSEKAGVSLQDAYEQGFDKVEQVMDWCLEQGEIKEVTFWGLSTENAIRPSLELKLLNKLYKAHLEELLKKDKIHRNKVNVRVVGNETYLNNGLGGIVSKVHDATKDYSDFKLNLALAYGGHEEIIHAVKSFLSNSSLEELNEENLQKHLYLPDAPDMIIRTSGIQRLSGYLSWQSAYSELYFTEKLWPEFSKEDFFKAVEFFKNTKRNFGK